MKRIKICIMKIGLFLASVCFVAFPLAGMNMLVQQDPSILFRAARTKKFWQENKPLKAKLAEIKKNSAVNPQSYRPESIWVKTSDNELMEIPRWKSKQINVFQVYLRQKSTSNNSKYNPIVLPPVGSPGAVSKQPLMLVSKALDKAGSSSNVFNEFFGSLTSEEQTLLINGAEDLDAQGLVSLIIGVKFPKELQERLGATIVQPKGIITPVLDYLYNIAPLKIVRKGRTGFLIRCLAYSPDGQYIVSGAEDTTLILYSVETGQQIKVFEGLPDGHAVTCVSYSPNGQYMVSGLSSGILILWNVETGEQIKVLKGQDAPVICASYSPNGEYIVSGGSTGSLVLWNGQTGEKIEVFKGHSSEVECVAYNHIGSYIVSGGDDKTLILWDAKTGNKINVLTGHSKPVSCVACSPDGKYIVSGSYDNTLILWPVETGELKKVLKGHSGGVTCVAYSPDGEYIVSGSYDKSLILWDSNTGNQIAVLKWYPEFVSCVGWSPDGSSMAVGGASNEVILAKLINSEGLRLIKNKLNIAQSRLLYRLYLATINKISVVIDNKDLDYQVYLTLPEPVKELVKTVFPFEFASDVAEKKIQEEMGAMRSSMFYNKKYFWGLFGGHEKTFEEKIAALEDFMKTIENSSSQYDAAQRLLGELKDRIELVPMWKPDITKE